MTNYNWVNKRVADAWLSRYRKEMSEEEFKTWQKSSIKKLLFIHM
jgi:hypothetical protein